MGRRRSINLATILLSLTSFSIATFVAACKREERGFRVQPPSAQTADLTVLTSFHAGPATEPSHLSNPYEQNAYAMSQGKLLYENFNCVGCHFHGGGGIGPPLMDDKW